MRKTYVTKVPDRSGVFLLASRIIAKHGGDIVRANYNHAVDIHTFFIEISADEEQHKKIEEELLANGFMTGSYDDMKIIMLDFNLANHAGAVIPVLEVLNRHQVYISYVSSGERTENGQHLRIGIRIDSPEKTKNLLDELSEICETRVIDYEVTDKQLDSTVFYVTFANEMRDILSLSPEDAHCVLIRANKLMQVLDAQDKSPLQTFDYIRRFAKFVVDHRGEKFDAKISTRDLADDLKMYVIEPPCGSNTYILEHEGDLLFVDGGYSCYFKEMLKLLNGCFEKFEERHKEAFITHVDMDHIGLMPLWEKVYMSRDSYEDFCLEHEGKMGFREQNARQKPYFNLSEIITGYETPDLTNAVVVGDREGDGLLPFIGSAEFGGRRFDFYQGPGGHVKGEVVIVCEALKLIFSGDIWVNVKGITPEQKEFNRLAPFLLTGVDEDPALARKCREYTVAKFGGYLFCPGHGPVQVVG